MMTTTQHMNGRTQAALCRRISIFIVLLGAVIATPVAADEYRTRNSGPWTHHSTWQIFDVGLNDWRAAEFGEYPESGDTATIQTIHGVFISVLSVGVSFLTIEPEAILEVGVDNTITTITIDGNSGLTLHDHASIHLYSQADMILTGTGASTIDGTICLDYNHFIRSAARLFIMADHTLHGSGWITGVHVDCRVMIGADAVLTAADHLVFEGEMTVQGLTGGITNGTLDLTEDSMIKSDTPGGTILLHQDLILDADNDVDSPIASFEASLVARDDGTLRIDCTAASSFDGNLLANNGRLDFDSNFETSSSGSSILALVSGGSCDIDADVCVSLWAMGCSGSAIDTVGGALYYDDFVNGGSCNSCDDPGSSVEGECRDYRFAGGTLRCD